MAWEKECMKYWTVAVCKIQLNLRQNVRMTLTMVYIPCYTAGVRKIYLKTSKIEEHIMDPVWNCKTLQNRVDHTQK